VQNFLSNTHDAKYASKILMILQKNYEFVPDVVEQQYLDCEDLPKAICEYIKCTDINDLTPDAFLLMKEIFQESTFAEVLDDEDFVSALMNSLTVINKTEYFDAICDILLVRFYAHSKGEDPHQEPNKDTQFFLDLIAEHENGNLFIETIIHLLNRNSNKERTVN
jgi:hypothetical protein